MTFLLYFIWAIYAIFSGMKDAVLWSLKGDDAFEFDEHNIFISERAALSTYVVVVVSAWQYLTPIDLIVSHVCYLISFPFFQAGMYYQSRYWIDKAYVGFWDDSTTSTARINFNFKLRLILFIISLVILTVYEVYI